MWLLEQEAAKKLQRVLSARVVPTAEQRKAFEGTSIEARGEGAAQRVISVAGSVAEIRVEGVLTKNRDIFMWFFDIPNTAYRDVIAALALAKSDPLITSVVLYVDSPGGHVSGLWDTIEAIQSFRAVKSISSVAADAQSAAYALVAASGKIVATNSGATFGSIGTAASFDLEEVEGTLNLTNTESPEKRPNLATEEGRAVWVKLLDDTYGLFASAIATGRGVTVEHVTATYRRGATLLAAEAKKLGMIDSITKPSTRTTSVATAAASSEPSDPPATPSTQHRAVGVTETADADPGAAEQETNDMSMDMKTLKAQHPQLCEELLREGEATGAAKEKRRCAAHIKMAESTGAIKVAHGAILSGASIQDDDVHAEYLTASLNRRDARAAQDDSDAAAAAAAGAAPAKTDRTLLDASADAYCGVKG